MERTKRRAFLKQFHARGRSPRFQFADLPPSKRLYYERLEGNNARQLLHMFEKDESPFISPMYKDAARLEGYLDLLLFYYPFTTERGACDWLLRLQENGQYIGILNLYELPKERKEYYQNACHIGYTTAHSFRRHGYTREAVQHLIRFLFLQYGLAKVYAHTHQDNTASQALLESLGFRDRREMRDQEDKFRYMQYLFSETS